MLCYCVKKEYSKAQLQLSPVVLLFYIVLPPQQILQKKH